MLTRLPLTTSFLFVLLFSSTALARSVSSEASQARTFPSPPVRALAAVVMDASNGQVLAAVNPHKHLPMASTTKIMTALVALDLGHLDDKITVPKAAFDYESDATVMGLRPGEVVTLRDLLYGLLLPSGADAANTIAIHYAGSEAKFVALMNHVAQVIGLKDTHYVDATGLSSNDHFTSAYDLAVLGQYVSYMPILLRITSTRSHLWNGHTLENVNRILFWYPGIDGLKPGFTNAAGLCQLLDVQRDGRHIVVSILNTPDMVIDARNLLDFGLRDFSWIQSKLPGDGPTLTQTGSDARGRYLYFPGAGHYLRGAFLNAFQPEGGLTALGFPRTEPLAEGTMQVQYFQNGALSFNPQSGKVQRLALGLDTVLSGQPAPKPFPTPTPTLYPGTGTPGPVRTPTPHPRLTATPAPRQTATPASGSFPTAGIFMSYQKWHSRRLGGAVSALLRVSGNSVQIFRYGALVAPPHSHAVTMLPIGDRFLAEHGFLPYHPGNVYPAGFAALSTLRAIGWLDTGSIAGHG